MHVVYVYGSGWLLGRAKNNRTASSIAFGDVASEKSSLVRKSKLLGFFLSNFQISIELSSNFQISIEFPKLLHRKQPQDARMT